MSKIAVTGANGYIGSCLVEKLVKLGHSVTVIVRETSNLDLLDKIRDKFDIIYYDSSAESLINGFKEKDIDVIYHIASLFISEHKTEDINNLIDSNIKYGTHILEAMKICNIQFIVNTGTSWQNYNNEEYNPVCLYAATKKAFEDIERFYVETSGISVINLVLYDTYGPNDPRKKIIQLFNRIASTGEKLEMSKGEQYIDLIYIDDIINAYIMAMERLIEGKEKGMKNYYVHSDNPVSLKEVAQIYAKVKNVTLNIDWGKRPYRAREVMYVYEKGEKMPGWDAKITLEEGLKKI